MKTQDFKSGRLLNAEAARQQVRSGYGAAIPILLVALLWLTVIASGMAVVYSTHLSRQLFAELDVLKRQTTDLHVEWSQYLLERSTLSAYDRVETLAASELKMQVPDPSQIVIVEARR